MWCGEHKDERIVLSCSSIVVDGDPSSSSSIINATDGRHVTRMVERLVWRGRIEAACVCVCVCG